MAQRTVWEGNIIVLSDMYTHTHTHACMHTHAHTPIEAHTHLHVSFFTALMVKSSSLVLRDQLAEKMCDLIQNGHENPWKQSSVSIKLLKNMWKIKGCGMRPPLDRHMDLVNSSESWETVPKVKMLVWVKKQFLLVLEANLLPLHCGEIVKSS